MSLRASGRALGLWAPPAAWAAVIFFFSAQGPTVAQAALPDAALHAGAYAVLGALACRALAGGVRGAVSWRAAMWAALLSAAYGATDELHQWFVPGRFAEVRDLAADAAGSATGAALAAGISRLLGGPAARATGV